MADNHRFFVYILTNKSNRVLYTGVTNDLVNRLNQHQNNESEFTARYHVHKLVYFEEFSQINEAIMREKQIKGGSRQKKINLIETINPDWKDLMQ